jgi:hypothetical protein
MIHEPVFKFSKCFKKLAVKPLKVAKGTNRANPVSVALRKACYGYPGNDRHSDTHANCIIECNGTAHFYVSNCWDTNISVYF